MALRIVIQYGLSFQITYYRVSNLGNFGAKRGKFERISVIGVWVQSEELDTSLAR